MRTLAIRALAALLLTTGGVLGASARAGVVVSVGVPGIVVAPPAAVYPPLAVPPITVGRYPRPYYYGYYPRYYRPAHLRYPWGYGYPRAHYCRGCAWR